MPAVARQGDAGRIHCTPYTIANGSPDVFVNNRPAARLGDSSTIHKERAGRRCRPHVSKISDGSSSVFINGKPVARIGDPLDKCTEIIEGSSDVFTE
jgi:uncharacterized Zn-binding protein involved in type VI secretion